MDSRGNRTVEWPLRGTLRAPCSPKLMMTVTLKGMGKLELHCDYGPRGTCCALVVGDEGKDKADRFQDSGLKVSGLSACTGSVSGPVTL